MRNIKYQKVEAVIGQNPQDYADKLSKALYEHRTENPIIDRIDMCVCYITYSVTEEIVEDICDTYEIEGCGMRCVDCPCFERDVNRFGEPLGNSKHGTCTYKAERTRLDTKACAHCYNVIEQKGGIAWLKKEKTEE